MAVVELQGLSKAFNGAPAVADVSLSIGHGQLVSLLGPSGCGKTTTLRLIAGFIVPDAGTIKVGDRVLSGPGQAVPPERRNMSMIFQSYALWPHMTVAENVAYGLKQHRLPRAEIEAKVKAILDLTQLGALAARYPHELSGGQQQRTALARALVVDPATLLLDEPLSNLDTNLREEMRDEIRRLQLRTQFTTVYVTHDRVEAMTTADLIVVMNRGRIEQAGSPEDIYESPRSQFVAGFVDRTNLLQGRPADGVVDCGGVLLRCANELPRTVEIAVSIRPYQIGMSPENGFARGVNRALGRVERQIYLGSSREYVVLLEQGQRLRVAAPTSMQAAPGTSVGLIFPPESCRALPA